MVKLTLLRFCAPVLPDKWDKQVQLLLYSTEHVPAVYASQVPYRPVFDFAAYVPAGAVPSVFDSAPQYSTLIVPSVLDSAPQ
jgi:hypothetical protein